MTALLAAVFTYLALAPEPLRVRGRQRHHSAASVPLLFNDPGPQTRVSVAGGGRLQSPAVGGHGSASTGPGSLLTVPPTAGPSSRLTRTATVGPSSLLTFTPTVGPSSLLTGPPTAGAASLLTRPGKALAVLSGSLRRLRARARRSLGTDDVAQALELAARSLRGGASLLTALGTVSNELPEVGLGDVVRRVEHGMGLKEALDHWVNGRVAEARTVATRLVRGGVRAEIGDRGRAERQTAAALLVLGHSSGAAMASSLDRAAASLRQRRTLGDEIRALTAQTRASAAVVALAPAGLAVVIAAVDPQALGVLFTTPIGLVALVTGLVLEGLGLWWMNRLCRGVARWA